MKKRIQLLAGVLLPLLVYGGLLALYYREAWGWLGLYTLGLAVFSFVYGIVWANDTNVGVELKRLMGEATSRYVSLVLFIGACILIVWLAPFAIIHASMRLATNGADVNNAPAPVGA